MKKMLKNIIKLINKTNNFVKMHKKKLIIGFGIFIMLFIPTFLYINLTNPTTINKYIAHVINKGAPANNAFDDEIFYRAVVDAYNKENSTSLPYTTNLTDDQLKTITSLYYNGYRKEKITNIKGIEKIINLKNLSLNWNNLTNADLSQNKLLQELNLDWNKLTDIDLSNNIFLIHLSLGSLSGYSDEHNEINNIDLSKNISLKTLHLDYNNLKKVDLSKNRFLTEVTLCSNGLEEIDISNNSDLKSLYLTDNELHGINLSSNINLERLDLADNNVKNIDIKKNILLKKIELFNNKLTSINLENNINLIKLDVRNNDLNNIDLSSNKNLTNIYLSGNYLSSIIFYDGFNLYLLPNIIKKQYSNQTYINFGNNTIINIYDNYKYYYSSKIIVPKSIEKDIFVSNLGLQNMTAKVYDKDTEIIEGIIKSGYTLKLLVDDIVIDSVVIKENEIPNASFDDEIFYNVVVDAYNKENNTNLPYTTNLTKEQLSTITSLSYNGNKKENSKKINSVKGIEQLSSLVTLDLQSNNLSEINLNNNVFLEEVNLSNNNISSIDLNKNQLLKELDTSNNKLEFIDLSNNDKLSIYNNRNFCNDNLDGSCEYKKLKDIKLPNNSLTMLNLSNNDLNKIDLNSNINLASLNLYKNKLISIDLSNSIILKTLDLGNNKIQSINLEKNTKLIDLYLQYNKLNGIDLSQNSELSYLYLYKNNLSKIDLSKNLNLKNLLIYGNKLTELDLSKNTKITSLELYDNPFIFKADIKINSEDELNSLVNIKLPERSDKYYITYDIENEDIAKITEDNRIKGLNIGETNVKVTLHGIKSSSSSSDSDMVIDGTINVYDRLKGDVNGDDKISSLDYIAIRKHIMKKELLSEVDENYADINGDGKVSSLDYISIKRYIMKGEF